MNKYAAASRASQKRRRKRRMSEDKRRYATAAEAAQKGQGSYACPHCHGYHRTGQLATLAAIVRRKK